MFGQSKPIVLRFCRLNNVFRLVNVSPMMCSNRCAAPVRATGIGSRTCTLATLDGMLGDHFVATEIQATQGRESRSHRRLTSVSVIRIRS